MKSSLICLVLVFCSFNLFGQALKPLLIQAGVYKVNNTKSTANELLGLSRIFDIQGIPYQIFENPEELSNYSTVFTAGTLLDNDIDHTVLNHLYDFVEAGGVLVSSGQIGKQLFPLFGVTSYVPSRKRYRIHFEGSDPAMQYIDRPEELTISLGNGEQHFYDEIIWTHGYKLMVNSRSLAVFDDKTSAFSRAQYGRGITYLMGVTYTDMVLIPQLGQDYEAQRKYVNSFEPSADVVMLILKSIYQTYTKPYVYLSPIPYAKATALILSHDVDAQTSFVDSQKYADLEKKYGVTSTFFETTKTFIDAMDIDYYNLVKNKNAIRQLKKSGWDIGSHTVSHSRQFAEFVKGSPKVSLQTYRPEINKTIFGELIVSKELLDRDIPDQNTISFRAGDLAFPFGLIGALEEAGYYYDSTFSANDVLSAFPYFAFKDRRIGSEVSNVIEIPVTLDDALSFLTEESLDQATETWIDVVNANKDNGAITVLLVHPSDTREKNYKLLAQEELMKHIIKLGGWMGNLTEFGEFFRSRSQIKLKVFRNSQGKLVIRSNKSEMHPMIGMVIGNLKDTNTEVEIQNSEGIKLHYTPIAKPSGERVMSMDNYFSVSN
jgi:peptidoglycan/xylan/chitin deacetylase (PgdA/CDA1 family)